MPIFTILRSQYQAKLSGLVDDMRARGEAYLLNPNENRLRVRVSVEEPDEADVFEEILKADSVKYWKGV